LNLASDSTRWSSAQLGSNTNQWRILKLDSFLFQIAATAEVEKFTGLVSGLVGEEAGSLMAHFSPEQAIDDHIP